MSKLIFPLGAKGGVGKSKLLIGIADYLSNKGIEFKAFDADDGNAGTSAAFSTTYPEAVAVDLTDVQDLDRLLEQAAENEITLLDLPANANRDFLGWFESATDPETLEELGLDLIGIATITPAPGDFAAVAKWASQLQDRCTYWTALNRKTVGRKEIPLEEAFAEYYGTKTGRTYREAFKPYEVEIPALEAHIIDAWADVTAEEGSGLPSQILEKLPLLKRARLRKWINRIHEQLEEVL